jgi:alpha-beta hydrolase superfamily lysophospholipase
MTDRWPQAHPRPDRRRVLAGLALLAAASALPGCATDTAVGDPQPLADPVIRDGWIAGADGTRLALSAWPSRGPTRAVILGLHGFGDYAPLTFTGAATAWSRAGIATYAPDQRGFGRNASRGRWPGADMLVRDAIALARAVRARHPGRPLLVAGHSMGGGVALAAAARGLPADALVLVAPAIAGGDQVNAFLRIGAHAIATFTPDRRFTGDGVVRIQASDNIAALRQAGRDPLYLRDPSGRELFGLLTLMDNAAAAAPRIAIPTLTLMGARDQVLRPASVRAVAARIPGGLWRLYPDGWHWLLRDLQAARVHADIAAFALALPPSRGPIAPGGDDG